MTPYYTLHSMRSSLMLLSLRGNNFSDLIPDAEGMYVFILQNSILNVHHIDGQLSSEISAFQRFLNENVFETTSTPHRCETSLANNSSDLYDRECFLYFQNNTTPYITKNKNYTDYIMLLKERLDSPTKSCKTQKHIKKKLFKTHLQHTF